MLARKPRSSAGWRCRDAAASLSEPTAATTQAPAACGCVQRRRIAVAQVGTASKTPTKTPEETFEETAS
ncbi:MAG: hypothetical protein QME25_05375, partial [Bacteroidota bacterium]|nr:hypothetical protein [Bacteroidota bacterium]